MGYKDFLNVYEFDCILPGLNEQVTFKPITTGQLKKLLVYENETNPIVIEQAFDNLIQGTVTTEGFDIDRLYLQDRNFLLIEIRKKTKGELYTFQFKCPKCKSDNVNNINLSNLPVIKREEPKDNEITISDKVRVSLDHVTRGEQKEAYSTLKVMNKSPSVVGAEMGIATMAAGIKKVFSPGGEEDLNFEDRIDLMENYINIDTFNKMKDWFATNDFGIKLTYRMKCDNCKFESEEQEIQFDSNFF